VDFYVKNTLRTPAQSDQIVGELYQRGWWHAQEFGADGDWGVINPDWDTAFLLPEWLLTQLCPRWRAVICTCFGGVGLLNSVGLVVVQGRWAGLEVRGVAGCCSWSSP
jgi:hypothetical protein